MIVLVC